MVRRLENVLKRSLQDVLKMPWRRLKLSWRCPEDHLKTSCKTSWRRLEDVWSRQIYWSSPWRLEEVLKTSSEDVWLRRIYSSWSRRLEHILKTSSEDRDERHLQDVFKMCSSRRMFTGLRWFLKLLEKDFRLAFSLDFLPKNHNFHNLGYWSSLQHRQRNYSFLLPLFHCLLAKNHFLQWGLFFRIWISYFLIRWTEQFFRKFRYICLTLEFVK